MQRPNRPKAVSLVIVIPLPHFTAVGQTLLAPPFLMTGPELYSLCRQFGCWSWSVWNIGEPVRGISSPLWLLLLSMGAAFGMPVIAVAKVLGTGFALGALLILGLILKDKVELPTVDVNLGSLPDGRSVLLGAVWNGNLAGCFFVGCHMVALGTPPWTYTTCALGNGSARRCSAGFECLAAALEGQPKSLKGTHLLAFLPVGLWLCFRLWYYGDLLPNTYYAKMGGPLGERL